MAMLQERGDGWRFGSHRTPSRTRHRIACTRGRAGVDGLDWAASSKEYGPYGACPGAADTGWAKSSVAGQQQGPHGQFGPQSQFVIAFTSFLEAQVRVRIASGKRDLEGGKLAIEFVEFGPAAGHSSSLG